MQHNLITTDGTCVGSVERTDGGPAPGIIQIGKTSYIREAGTTAYRQAIVLKLDAGQVTHKTKHNLDPIANPQPAAAEEASENPNG